MNLHILNAQTGHTTLTYNPKNAEEVEQAETQINEMLEAGFSIFVELEDGKTEKVQKFDANRGRYLIGGRSGRIEIPLEEAKQATAVPPSAGGCERE